MVMPVPTLALAKVKTGLPPMDTTSPDATPERVTVPVADPAVVPSYTLFNPEIPITVNSLAVISPAVAQEPMVNPGKSVSKRQIAKVKKLLC